MELRNPKATIKDALRPGNIIPGLTILSAGVVVSLGLLQKITLDLAHGMLIALIALLAADALTERLSILRRIEFYLSHSSKTRVLRPRSDLPAIGESIAHAADILIVAISGVSIIQQNQHMFLSRIKEGARIRIALLDPKSPSLETLYLQYGLSIAAKDVEVSLEILRSSTASIKTKDSCKVKLLKVFLPFSAVATDLNKPTGSMVVEFHTYKKTIGERAHVLLTASADSHWYDFYREQLEQAWEDGVEWNPSQAST